MGYDSTTVHSLERVDSERGGVWVDLSATEDYELKFHGSVDSGGGKRHDGGSYLEALSR